MYTSLMSIIKKKENGKCNNQIPQTLILIRSNIGKVNLETSLAGKRSSPRQAGLCRVATGSARAFK